MVPDIDRVLSRMQTTMTNKWSRVRAIAACPLRSDDYPLELWLGRLSPLNPYIRAAMVMYLCSAVKPREIRLVLPELLFDGKIP